MTQDETMTSLLAALAAMEAMEKDKSEWLKGWRSDYDRLKLDVARYRRKLSGEDTQLELGE
jgi:septation ring formation regulator EzrA